MEFGKLSSYKIDGQNVILDFEGREAQIRVVTPQIIQVFCALEDAGEVSKAIEGDKRLPTVVNTEEKEDGLWITTEKVRVRVSDGFYVDFFDLEGKEVCVDYRGERTFLWIGRKSWIFG